MNDGRVIDVMGEPIGESIINYNLALALGKKYRQE